MTQPTTRQCRKRRSSRFKTVEEAGAFWDTHSPEDFPEEFEEVQVKCSRPLINLLSSPGKPHKVGP